VDNLLSPTHRLSHRMPILVKDTAESIGMNIPKSPDYTSSSSSSSNTNCSDQHHQAQISISDVGELVGMNHPVTVMDVRLQEELDGWNFSDLVDYFTDEDRLYTNRLQQRGNKERQGPKRVLNQISLEFSQTPLGNHVRSPSFVREMDWIHNSVWPRQRRQEGDYPRVHYYCLTSTAGCYTDFHVDFGGTSVYYHVLSGKKTFLFIPPTEVNLALYEKWLCSKNQSNIFYPDMEAEVESMGKDGEKVMIKQKVGPVIRVTLEANQTMFIPTAWIHAVYTPVDSIVIGGNFLHSLDMKLQLDVYCLETRTRVPAKFRFPSFVQVMFYAGLYYYRKFRNPKMYGDVCKDEVDGLGPLIDALKLWSMHQDVEEGKVKGSTSHVIIECLTKVQETNKDITNFSEVLSILEKELASIKKDERRYSSTQNLRPSLKVILPTISSEKESSSDGKDSQNNSKPRLKLKLGKRKLNEVPESKSLMKRKKPRIIRDLASKLEVQNEDDDEWEPGSKCKRKKKKKRVVPKNKSKPQLQQSPAIGQVKQGTEELKPVAPKSSLISLKQKSTQRKGQAKKSLKKKPSVKERLRRKM
jgi:hypothetical protein